VNAIESGAESGTGDLEVLRLPEQCGREALGKTVGHAPLLDLIFIVGEVVNAIVNHVSGMRVATRVVDVDLAALLVLGPKRATMASGATGAALNLSGWRHHVGML